MSKKQKFNEIGHMKWFPGNTIISDLSQNKDVMYVIRSIQEAYKNLPFAHKYALLPEESIHMTVFELLCHFNRKSSHWSKRLSLDAPLEKIDLRLYEMLSNMKPPIHFKMKPLSLVDRTVISVEPFDEETKQILKEFRDHIAHITGVKFPNHDTYQFHISFGYKIAELTEAEKETIQCLNARLTEEIISKVDSIHIEEINYTVFEDMSKFVPYERDARKKLREEKGY